ncbi:MAG: ACT domain-containing protein [Anaerolineae bacterium]
MKYPPGLRHVIAETRLFTDAQSYVIAKLPAHQSEEVIHILTDLDNPLITLVWDKDEVTLVLPQEVWEARRPMLDVEEESPSYRLITFDLPLDLGLVGYLAILATTVAEAGVSIFSISAYSRDHFLVPEDDFDRAWDALRALIRSCQVDEANDDF